MSACVVFGVATSAASTRPRQVAEVAERLAARRSAAPPSRPRRVEVGAPRRARLSGQRAQRGELVQRSRSRRSRRRRSGGGFTRHLRARAGGGRSRGSCARSAGTAPPASRRHGARPAPVRDTRPASAARHARARRAPSSRGSRAVELPGGPRSSCRAKARSAGRLRPRAPRRGHGALDGDVARARRSHQSPAVARARDHREVSRPRADAPRSRARPRGAVARARTSLGLRPRGCRAGEPATARPDPAHEHRGVRGEPEARNEERPASAMPLDAGAVALRAAQRHPPRGRRRRPGDPAPAPSRVAKASAVPRRATSTRSAPPGRRRGAPPAASRGATTRRQSASPRIASPGRRARCDAARHDGLRSERRRDAPEKARVPDHVAAPEPPRLDRRGGRSIRSASARIQSRRARHVPGEEVEERADADRHARVEARRGGARSTLPAAGSRARPAARRAAPRGSAATHLDVVAEAVLHRRRHGSPDSAPRGSAPHRRRSRAPPRRETPEARGRRATTSSFGTKSVPTKFCSERPARVARGELHAHAVAQHERCVLQHLAIGRIAIREVQGVRVGQHQLMRPAARDHATNPLLGLVVGERRDGDVEDTHESRLSPPMPEHALSPLPRRLPSRRRG